MKKLSILFLLFGFISVSCSDNDDNDPILDPVESEQMTNLPAPLTSNFGEPDAGPFTKFDFETGQITENETEWDIAFRGLAIAVNGGTSTGTNGEPERTGDAAAALVIGSTFNEVTTAEGLTFEQDSFMGYAIVKESDSGWYNYNTDTNVVSAIPGRVLIFRTRDGKYAKVEILSYYKDNPAEITSEIAFTDFRYYTFNYVYNPNEGGLDF